MLASATSSADLLDSSEGLLRSAGKTGVRANLLEIHHPSAPLFDPVFLHTESEAYGVSLSLAQNEHSPAGPRVCCDSASLPFQDGAFCMVVLHHVVSDGSEKELSEACRVLDRSGVLILLGLNRMGWRFRSQDRIRRLPGIAPLRVKQSLERLDMTMQGFAGAGLAGRDRPAVMSRGLSSVGVPLADLLLLQAGHCDGPEMTPLRFTKPGAGHVQSAANPG